MSYNIRSWRPSYRIHSLFRFGFPIWDPGISFLDLQVRMMKIFFVCLIINDGTVIEDGEPGEVAAEQTQLIRGKTVFVGDLRCLKRWFQFGHHTGSWENYYLCVTLLRFSLKEKKMVMISSVFKGKTWLVWVTWINCCRLLISQLKHWTQCCHLLRRRFNRWYRYFLDMRLSLGVQFSLMESNIVKGSSIQGISKSEYFYKTGIRRYQKVYYSEVTMKSMGNETRYAIRSVYKEKRPGIVTRRRKFVYKRFQFMAHKILCNNLISYFCIDFEYFGY